MSKNKLTNFIDRKGLIKTYYPTSYSSQLDMTDDEKKVNVIYVYHDKIEVRYCFKTGDEEPTNISLIRYPYIKEIPSGNKSIPLGNTFGNINKSANNYSLFLVADPSVLGTNARYMGIVSFPRL